MRPSVAWSLVVLQIALLVTLVALPPGNLWARHQLVWLLGVGVIVAALALALVAGIRLGSNLTPNPIPRDHGELVVTGVYRWVRHPIYTALMMVGVGLALIGASLGHIVAVVMLLILLGVKARVEERLLIARFSSYQEYQRHTGRFIPGVGRIPGKLSGKK